MKNPFARLPLLFATLSVTLALLAAGGCASPASGEDCAAPLALCDGSCVDLDGDAEHCGACGATCGAGEACHAGACVVIAAGDDTDGGDDACPAELAECPGGCADLRSDPLNCGACGFACADGEACVAGACVCAGDGCAPTCPAGLEECAGTCTDLSSDPEHCGSCDATCGDGEDCRDGACVVVCVGADCVPACPSPLTQCGDGCVDLENDPENCGDCETLCGDGEACIEGGCAPLCPDGDCSPPETCPAGLAECDGACVDLLRDERHCSACSVACAAGSRCQGGRCVLSCPAGQDACDDRCVDLQRDEENCGGCGETCAAGLQCDGGRCALSCPPGLTDCDGVCVDLLGDDANCGRCGGACVGDQSCDGGVCSAPCPADRTLCDGGCVDLAFDDAHCGACGSACGLGETCAGGSCVVPCGGGRVTCGDTCVDVLTDEDHCGGCGQGCPAGEVCLGGDCTLICSGGRSACGGVCVDLANDESACGDCETVCAPGEACLAGVCSLVCSGDREACVGACVNTSTDEDHCGGCGESCAPGEACLGGRCSVVCAQGRDLCGGDCVDLANDEDNCGACSEVCERLERCEDGVCSCPWPLLVCGGECGVFDDSDGDAICDADDTCPGGDDRLDADGDGVCDRLDACPTVGCAPAEPPAAWPLAPTAFTTSDGSLALHFTAPGTAPDEGEDPELDDFLVNALLAAERTVDLCLYEFDREDIVDAALDAAARGVNVRFVGDGDEVGDDGYVALAAAGVPMSLRDAGDDIMHDKFGVIDGHLVFTGSTNLTDTGTLRNNNNLVVVDSVALADLYTAEFEQMFVDGQFGRRKHSVAPDGPIDAAGRDLDVFFAPADGPDTRLRQLLADADHSVLFLVFSFTHDGIAADLTALHRAGVEVVGVFDSSQAASQYSQDDALAAAGLPVFHDGNDNTSGFAGGKLHHKVMIIDAGTDSEPTVVTGSYNWSAAASEDNDENVLVLRGDDLVQPFLREFCARLDEAALHPAFEGELPDPCTARVRTVRINEFLPNPDPAGATGEFVEIVNAGAGPVDLSGWTLGDGDRADRHVFDGAPLAPGGAVVVWSGQAPNGSGHASATSGDLTLEPAGDVIRLFDATGALIDRAGWQSAAPGVSFNRSDDGGAGEDDVDSAEGPGGFVLHTVHGPPYSPGARADTSAWAAFHWGGYVFVNELRAAAPAFVEVLNTAPFPVDLAGWAIAIDGVERHVFPTDTVLQPGDALLVSEDATHGADNAQAPSDGSLALPATDGSLALRDAAGDDIDVLHWDVAPDDGSLNRSPDATPGAPLAAHASLTGALGPASPGARADGRPWTGAAEPPILVINEVLPNPAGTDTGAEFIEIVNAGAVTADLSGHTVGDENDPHRHLFAAGTYLPPGAALVLFDRGDHSDIPNALTATTGTLSLNNSGDTVTLRDATGAAIASATWTSCRDGVSLNRDPDGDPDAPLVDHDDLPNSCGPSSPGTRSDGTAF